MARMDIIALSVDVTNQHKCTQGLLTVFIVSNALSLRLDCLEPRLFPYGAFLHSRVVKHQRLRHSIDWIQLIWCGAVMARLRRRWEYGLTCPLHPRPSSAPTGFPRHLGLEE